MSGSAVVPDRVLSNARARRFLQAIADEMGQSGLATILRQAGLQRYAGNLPSLDEMTGLRASEYAALMQAIENYYGRGARGTLTRIGYASFKRLVESRRVRARSFRAVLRLLPPPARRVQVLRWLAAEGGGRGKVKVHLDDRSVIVVDQEGLAATGRSRDQSLCWVMLGEIQEALKWGTGRDYDVAEMTCRAKGDPACRFEIGEPVT